MGQNISAEQAKMVADHLNKQEELVRHLQAVVAQQQRALENLRVEPVLDASKEKDYDGNESGDEEFHRICTNAAGRENRRARESKVKEDELKKPDNPVRIPTKDDEKNFMATKPWLGRLFPPTNYQKDPKWDEAPGIKLTLEHVYGYRSRLARNNVFHISDDVLLYFSAAVVIVHNLANNTQKFLLGHDDDILCIDYHAAKRLVATGQQGKNPSVIVWNLDTMTELTRITGYHKRAVLSVAISQDGSKVASVGADDNYSVAINDTTTGALVAESKGDSNRILDVQWNTTKSANPNTDFVTVGEKHIKFWSIASNRLQFASGVLGEEGDRQTFLTCGFTPEYTVVGTKSGDLYLFKGNKLDPKMSFSAHNGMVYSVWVDTAGGSVYTGGKDGYVYVWGSTDFKKKKMYDLNKLTKGAKNSVRAINGRPNSTVVYAGTITSQIVKVDLKTADPTVVVNSHFGDLLATEDNYGELWGLSPHPSKPQFATVAEDRTLRVWDVPTRKMLSSFNVQSPGLCCAFSPDGKKIAVGLVDGQFLVYDVAGKVEEIRKRVGKRRVTTIKYSPNGKYLAVGHAENTAVVYSVEEEYKKLGTCQGASSVVLHLDWSEDSKYLQTNSQAYELLHFELNGTFVAKASDLRDTKWATQECVLGWDVQGIWPEESDGSDVNAVNRSNKKEGKKYLVSAEDSGLVKVYNFPCVGSHLNKEGILTKRPMSYRAYGHSSHVTNANFVFDDSYVISTGGADLAVMQWKVETA